MDGNIFGQWLQLVSFGESHGPAIGGVLLGLPAGFPLDIAAVQAALDRRRPGQSSVTTARNERDEIEILSGFFEGKTLGTPLAFLLRNQDQRSEDYQHLNKVYRPSHADFTWDAKFGFRDPRGGGRASARETAVRVAAGAMVQQMLLASGIRVKAWTQVIGPIQNQLSPELSFEAEVDTNAVRCPDANAANRMELLIAKTRQEGDSLGGIIHCRVEGVPAGLGEPVFQKLNAALSGALASINAVKGVEIGMGFAGSGQLGSEVNDAFYIHEGDIATATNHSGGIQGGISNGMPLLCAVAFKPVATIAKLQSSVTRHKEEVTLEAKGRHDPCVVPRAVPIVEAMVALVLGDFMLRQGFWPRQWDKKTI